MSALTDLAIVWAGIVAFAIYAYVVLDGFDLGIGILMPFASRDDEEEMISSIAPVWDGNETWLVLGGGGLMAAFPLAYSILLPALYAPIIAMLLALIFRGVAFEFRHRRDEHRRAWTLGFIAGSYVASFAQGVALGAFIQGVAVSGRSYAGGWFDWLTPFSLFVGLALLVGYALLGCGFLIMKAEGRLQDRMFVLARPLGIAVLAAIAGVSSWTPFVDRAIAERWFSWPNIAFLLPVPISVAVIAFVFYAAVLARREVLPFLMTALLFLACYIGIAISAFPFVVPRTVTVWDAAAPDASLGFLLVGASVLLPLILAYTGYSYWVFRGKTGNSTHYHP